MAPSIYGAASWFDVGHANRSVSLQADKVASFFLDSSLSLPPPPSPRSPRANPHSFIAAPISSATAAALVSTTQRHTVPSAFFIHGHSCRSEDERIRGHRQIDIRRALLDRLSWFLASFVYSISFWISLFVSTVTTSKHV